MSQFNYSDYQNIVAKAQAASSNNAVKVGFFKLKNDGDTALVRINVSTMNDLQFNAVHQLGAASRWMKISCLTPIGSYDHDNCPLCKAIDAGDTSIGRASKKVYVQMMVAYLDSATGKYGNPEPVVWERPAGFSREVANLLNNYGNLKEHVLKITRNGAAGSMQTTYSINYIPMFDKEDIIPNDFSAFSNFNIAKHSYWEKTAEEIEEFLATGSFPEKASTQSTTISSTPVNTQVSTPVKTTAAPVAEKPVAEPVYITAPAAKESVPESAPETTDRPVRNFSKFSF